MKPPRPKNINHIRWLTARYLLSVSFGVVGLSASAASVSSLPTDIVKGRAPIADEVLINNESTPNIPPSVGSKLKGSYKYVDADGDGEYGSRFQWKRGGADIGGATSVNYTVQESDSSQELSFQVTVGSVATSDPDRGAPTVSSPVQVKGPGSAPVAIRVEANGERTVGQKLTASYQYNDVDGDLEGTSAYQWIRGCNGMPFCTDIPGATNLTYTLQKDDEGAYVFFRVTPKSLTGIPSVGSKADSPFGSKVSPKPNSVPVVTNVAVAGPVAVFATLTATYNYSDADGDAESGTTFQWRRNGNAIGGATSRTYNVSTEDIDDRLSVTVIPRSSSATANTGSAVTSGEVSLSRPVKVFLASARIVMEPRSGGGIEYSSAQSYCSGRGGMLPSSSAYTELVNSTKTAGTTKLCDVYGWPLQGPCGGNDNYYWTSTIDSSSKLPWAYHVINNGPNDFVQSDPATVACAINP